MGKEVGPSMRRGQASVLNRADSREGFTDRATELRVWAGLCSKALMVVEEEQGGILGR